MIKKLRVLVFVGVALACLMPLAAGAYTIDFSFTTGGVGGNEFYSPYQGNAGFVTEDFNFAPGTTQWAWSGNGQFKTGSSSTGAAPAGVGGVADPTKYVSVPLVNSDPRTFTAVLGGTYNYLGLWWGSADWQFNNIYNQIMFYNGDGNLVETVNGNVAGQPDANGSWYDPTANAYVNIYNLPAFDRFTMYSSTYAFEADNMTVGVVPEPATMLLLGLGLIGLAGIRRKMQ